MSDKNIDDQNLENQSTDADSSYDEPYEGDVTYEDDSVEWSDSSDDDLDALRAEDDLDEDASEEEQPPAKKKTSNLTIGIILFVAIIGVFGFMALTGNKDTAPSVTDTQVAIDADAPADSSDTSNAAQQSSDLAGLKTQADPVEDPSANVAPSPTTAPQGLMDNPDLLNQNPNTTDAAPQTGEPAPLLTGAEEPESKDASKDVVSVISPTVKPVSDFPTVDSIKKPDTLDAEPAPSVPVAPVAEADSVLPVPTSAQDNTSSQLQAQVEAADKKIAALQKQLSDKNDELKAEKLKTAAAMAAAKNTQEDTSASEVDALKTKVAGLEAKLAAKTAASSKAAAPESAVVENETDYSVTATPAKKPAAETVKPKVVAKQWSLKGAGAGKAILSDKSTGDLKTVRVGDSVAGLGRIVSISEGRTGWVVKGTSGSVSE